MTKECIADAHALLWFLEGNPKLGNEAREWMSDASSGIVVPAIALAEVCRVVEKGRSTIPSVRDLIETIRADARVVVEPVDLDLIERCIDLTTVSEIHDRLILAAAIRRHEANASTVLLTADASIRSSDAVPMIW